MSWTRLYGNNKCYSHPKQVKEAQCLTQECRACLFKLKCMQVTLALTFPRKILNTKSSHCITTEGKKSSVHIALNTLCIKRTHIQNDYCYLSILGLYRFILRRECMIILWTAAFASPCKSSRAENNTRLPVSVQSEGIACSAVAFNWLAVNSTRSKG